MDYKKNDLLLEGPLNNLANSPINLPKPQRRSERNRNNNNNNGGGGGGGGGGNNNYQRDARDDFDRSGPRYDDYTNVDSRDDPRYRENGNRGYEQGFDDDQTYGYGYDYVHGGGNDGGGYGDDDYDDMSYGYAAGSSAQYEEAYDGGDGDGNDKGKSQGGFATQPASQSQASFTQNTDASQSQFSQSQNFSQGNWIIEKRKIRLQITKQIK